MEAFENYFKKADLDQDGKISGLEFVVYFEGRFDVSHQVLAQIWGYTSQNENGFLGRQEFFNALRLITVAQCGRTLTPEIVNSVLYYPAAANKIPAPQMKSVGPTPAPQVTPNRAMPQGVNPAVSSSSQMSALTPTQYMGARSPQVTAPNWGMNHQILPASSASPFQALGVTQGLGLRSPSPSPSSFQEYGANQGLVGGSTVPGPRLATSGTMELSGAWRRSLHENHLGSQGSTPTREQGNVEDICAQLQAALADAAKYRFELSEEICKREKAEMDLASLFQKAEETQNALLKEKQEVEPLHKEIEMCKSRLDLLQEENKKLQEERDKAIKQVEELHDGAGRGSYEAFSEFSLLELQQATENFSNSHKIGEGGFGCVYKGFLRNTMVAVKMLHPESLQGRPEFEQEVTILSTIRHPNLVTLIGTCSEQSALVYEYLPNGSLEDRLACQGGTPPLTWQMRTRIIGEICRALLFLHSNNPNPIVHGDLNPSNILLDANLVSKLSDFGISRLLIESNTNTLVYRTENPKGTFAYMDPEFLRSGQITVKSDVYSFGIIVLRLLTGKPPVNIVADVEDAIETDLLHSIIDKSAGDWPFVQAKQLTKLGLRCTEMHRKKRPNFESEWKLVESLMMAASLSVLPSFKSQLDDKGIPSYFMCPIFQEVMKDPHIAADGYTYEVEAIKGWLDGGHETSPMTNLPLGHLELTPNHALRSAVQEWLQHQS